MAGQGCMMYSLVLSYELRPHLRMLDEAHREVMGRLMESISFVVSRCQDGRNLRPDLEREKILRKCTPVQTEVPFVSRNHPLQLPSPPHLAIFTGTPLANLIIVKKDPIPIS